MRVNNDKIVSKKILKIKDVEIMEENTMLKLLDRFEWLLVRNRLFEAKRLVKQELENIKGITEQKCKKMKLSRDYCVMCKNYNCNKKILSFKK